jgi:hypothetical protein
MFPIPRITESFVDSIAQEVGWRRYLDVHTPNAGRLNADYLANNAVIELKIMEEEGLDKESRQAKLAKLFSQANPNASQIDLTFENTPDSIKRQVHAVVSMPIQSAVKKASRQIAHSAEDLGRHSDNGVLLMVNNGYSYLNAENFERLVVQRCWNDSSHIDYAFCVTIDYHQGDFDSYIFLTARCHTIRNEGTWAMADVVADRFQARFGDVMGQMMGDQMNPKLWRNRLPPVTDILFEKTGVKYIRKAPEVPDSRFS